MRIMQSIKLQNQANYGMNHARVNKTTVTSFVRRHAFMDNDGVNEGHDHKCMKNDEHCGHPLSGDVQAAYEIVDFPRSIVN